MVQLELEVRVELELLLKQGWLVLLEELEVPQEFYI
jgi:hypothetical protein